MQVMWLFAAVIAVTALSIVVVTWKRRRRSRQLSEIAGSLGLDYWANGAALLNEGLADLPLFALGALVHRGTVSNVMRGPIAGVWVTACDYAYWTGSANTQRFEYAQTIACFELEPNRYPAFTVAPLGGRLQQASTSLAGGTADVLTVLAKPFDGDRRFAALETMLEGAHDAAIELDTSPEFSSHYRVMGRDRDGIARQLNGPALDSLMRGAFHPLSLESSGRWLAIYRKNHRVAPQDVASFLQRCVELRKSLFTS